MTDHEIYEFGAFRLDVAEHSLSEGGRPVALKPKVFETLVLLVRNAGHLLSKQELMSRLWPDAVVDETNLNKNVWLIRRALGESGDTSESIETVPRIGYRFIGAVRRVEPEPPPRPVETASLATAAHSPSEPQQGSAPPARPRRLPSRTMVFGAAVVATAIGVVLALRFRDPAGFLATGPARRTITVLGFRNLSSRPELDWIATALSEMVQAELAPPGSSYRLMPVESAERLRRELGLARPGSLSPESLSRLRRAAAVDEVVGGSYASSGSGPDDSRIRIDVLVQDARTGDTIAAVSESGESSRLFELVSSIGSRLRLSLREPGRAPAERSASALPRNPEALRLYAEGLQRLRDFDALAARDLLSRAVAAESNFPLAHSALGRAYATLGYEENARLELQQALASSRGLPRRDQLDIEAAYRAANKEWDEAIRLYQELDGLSSDDLETGLRLAATENNASRSREALEVVRRLRRLPPPTGNDPRIDLLESRILMRTDPQAALAAAERGLAESRARHERLLEANALLDREVALHTLGRSGKPALEEALRIFSAAGDSGGEARAAHILGDARFDEGDLKAARASYRHAIDTADRIGYVLEKAAAAASLSRVASLQGDSAEAESLIVEANAIWRAVPDRRQLPWGLNALGSMRLAEGKLDEAAALHREAMTMCRQNGDQGSYLHDGYSGLIVALEAQGRLEEASAVGEEALKRSTERAEPSWIAQHLVELGSIAFERARFADADRMFAQALEKRRQAHENTTVPESELLIAQLRLEERKPDEARALARKASDAFAAAGRPADQAGADAVEAEAMLLAGRRDEAKTSADAASALLDEKASADARVPVLLARARVDNALGRPEAARAEVETAAALARKTAWKSLVFETRLAAAEVSADSRSSAAAPEAAALATEARGLGFERLAKRADHLSAPRP